MQNQKPYSKPHNDMKRIIILLFVTFSLAAISAPTDSVQKTVTLTQAQFDSLTRAATLTAQQKAVAQEAVKESTDQLRSEMESRYNTYVTHVGWIVALFSVLAGIIVPLMINADYKKDIKLKISFLERKLIEAEKSAQKADEAKVYTENAAQAVPYFYQALNEKDLNKQIELYTKAIELNPDFAEAYNNRGVAYKEKGDIPKAIEDYTKAIKLNPNYATAYYNRGSAYDDKEDFDKVIEDYTKAIELNPNDAKAYNNIANTYLKIGELDQALTNANIAIEKDPQRAIPHDTRADIYIAMAEKETDNGKAKEYYQKAWDDCNTGLSLNPDEKNKKLLEAKKQLCEERLKNL